MNALEDMIFTITPVESPFWEVFKHARVQFRSGKGGGMRKQRRRKAKPVRFTAATGAKRVIHEWHRDTLIRSKA